MVDVIEPGAFIGRASELARIDGAYRRVEAGRAASVLVGGEAGIGKTRLVDQALIPIRTAGATVLAGACLEFGEAVVPYAPLADAIRGLIRSLEPALVAGLLGPLRPELARLVPELGDQGPVTDEPERAARARLYEATLRLVERLADRAPVVLVIEDLQWADTATRDLLRYLIGGLRRSRLLFLGTFRSDELAGEHPIVDWLAELTRDGAERLELVGFDRSEVSDHAAALLGVPVPHRLAERLRERTDGNPFFLEALLDEVVRGGWTATANADPDRLLERLEGPLPPGLHDVLAARVADLDEPTTDLIRAASAAGPRIDDRILAEVVGQPVRVVGRGLRRGVERGVLVVIRGPDGGVGHAFRHTLLRELVRSELGPGERQDLHAAFARALEGRATAPAPAPRTASGEERMAVQVPAAELAYHWDAAGDARRALPALVRAVRAAERTYAFDDVRRHARRALVLWERLDDPELLVPVDRIGLLDRCAFASALLGEYEPAIRDAREALAAAQTAGDRLRASLLHERLRWILWESGARGLAMAEVEAALRGLSADGPTATRAKVLAHLAGMRMFAGQLDAAREAADEALAAARTVSASPEEAIALAVLGWIRALSGEVDAGLADFRSAIAIAAEVDSVEGIGLGHANLAALLDRIGRPSEALDAARDGLAIVRRFGMERTYGGQLRGSAANALFVLGRWDEAEQTTDEGLELDPAGPAAIWLHVNRARLDAARGRFAEADRHLDAARRIDDALGGTEYRTTLLAAAAERALWEGNAAEARLVADQGLTLAGAASIPDPDIAWLAALALRSAADLAEHARVRRDQAGLVQTTQRARAIAARLPGPDHPPDAAWGARGRALLALCGAELARLDGQDGADPIAWDESAVAWEAVERPFPAAYSRFRQAEAVLATRSSREVARTALGVARHTARRLGAAPLLAAVDLLARHARLDLEAPATIVPSPAGRPARTDDVAGLGFTARELEVLKLVAGGWTNQQIADALFITRKTASVHVSNILAKLGVAGRGEAAAIAHRLGLGRDAPAPPDSDAVV